MARPFMDLHKRKREMDEASSQQPGTLSQQQQQMYHHHQQQHHHQQAPPPPPPQQQHHHVPIPTPTPNTTTTTTLQQASPGLINYLPRPDAERLGLIQGDVDTFADIINLLGEYEGVLDRQESLAANLGAKLTGPRLLKGIEKFFDGPIKTNSPQPFSNPVSWLDVVSFAKSNPNGFALTTSPDGVRCCQFSCKGVQVEITEDDWRLISSGALDRFPLEHPFEEDETAEMATLDILEQRTSVLYKKADEVAARARILHHRLGHRKHDITRRRNTHEGGSSRFQAVNQPQRSPSFTPSYDLHADLLQQFIAASTSATPSRSTSGAGLSAGSMGALSPPLNSPHHRLSGQSGRSSTGNTTDPGIQAVADSRADMFRPLITQRTDKLLKGDTINPPCDRCRRLRLQCVKHLTACQGCTKKHAKCSWKAVTDEEMSRLRSEVGFAEGGERDMDTEVEPPPSQDSMADRLPGISTPSTMATDATSRPGSRAETDAGMPGIYSPDHMSNGRQDLGSEPSPRTSLPLGPGLAGRMTSVPRDQSRLNQVASIMNETDYTPSPFTHPQPSAPSAPG